MKIPNTYNEWNELLKELANRNQDQKVLESMKQGKLQIQAGVYPRFIKKLIEVVNARMDNASDRFNKELSYAKGQETLIVKALLGLRKEMNFLIEVVSIPAIPEKDREMYINLIKNQANKMQTSLEESAKNNESSGRMLFIVRNNRINKF